jgi:hypothetical protein
MEEECHVKRFANLMNVGVLKENFGPSENTALYDTLATSKERQHRRLP